MPLRAQAFEVKSSTTSWQHYMSASSRQHRSHFTLYFLLLLTVCRILGLLAEAEPAAFQPLLEAASVIQKHSFLFATWQFIFTACWLQLFGFAGRD